MKRDNESLKEMKETEARLKELYLATRHGGWRWQAVGAVSGLASGIIAAILGTLLSAWAWMPGAETVVGLSLHGAGSLLLLSTIPLLILGACCLDLLETRMGTSEQVSSVDVIKAVGRSGHARARVIAIAVLVVLLGGIHLRTQAQQTIFNVPTTDVLDEGKVYGELDASFKPNDSEAVKRFSSFVPRVVVGAGGHVEVGLNLTGNIQPGPDTTTLVPAVKWKFYQGTENGIALAAGDHLFVPVRHRAYNVGNYLYVEISKTFKAGTRLTAGGYDFTKNVVAASNRAGGQFGFEQPVNKRLTLAADWFTGKHSAGYFTPGAVFKLSPKLTGYVGYSLGNTNLARGNHFFLLELGYNFN
ncbi:MAG: hypothetical protein QOD00_266 [Blastocatellia bacterium]|nr:hypothetical protein [Blastocatellia bacterium]